MIYIYKEKNMFPHAMYFHYARSLEIFPTNSVREWLKEHIGSYRKDWTLIPNKVVLHNDPNSYEFWDHPYAFKSLEDAMAFKLRWT